MKHIPKYWRARITYRAPTGNKTAIKHVDAPDRETAKRRAVSICRTPVRDNVASVTLVPVSPLEVVC